MTTADLKQVFCHTMNMIDSDPELKRSTEDVCQRTTVYETGFHSSKAHKRNEACPVKVTESTTFKCAHSFTGSGKIAVLNFANPIEPGGNVKGGARAQEESLCRCSNLYRSLIMPHVAERYYQIHQADHQNYLFSDRIIYSPGITVFKADETFDILPDPFQVDVITCAAPYNVYGHERNVLESTYQSRLTNIFETAIENDVDILILGAFGCGVFRNPPELMAETFKSLIANKYNQYFDQIRFAIRKPTAFDKNFTVFSQILGEPSLA